MPTDEQIRRALIAACLQIWTRLRDQEQDVLQVAADMRKAADMAICQLKNAEEIR